MILYNQVSNIPLSKGFYLGYLKLQASLELNRVLVPKKAPNILPNVKIRDCPNVSRCVLSQRKHQIFCLMSKSEIALMCQGMSDDYSIRKMQCHLENSRLERIWIIMKSWLYCSVSSTNAVCW